jgi:hypothetical protein
MSERVIGYLGIAVWFASVRVWSPWGFDLALFIDHSHLGHFDAMIAVFRINEKNYCAVFAQPHLVFWARTGHVRPSQKRLMRAEASIRSSSEVA